MFERVTTNAGFRALKRDWDELYRASGVSNPFLSHEWLAAWTEHMSEGFAALCQRPRAGAPLTAAGVFATDQSDRWCYLTEHSYRPGLLVRDARLRYPLRPFLRYIFTREPRVWRVDLDRSPDTDEFRREIAGTLGPLRFLCVPEKNTVPERLIDVDSSFDEYLATRPSKKVRQEIRRKLRQMERKMPGAQFGEVEAAVGGRGAIDIVAHVEADSWKVEADTAIISHQNERDFYAAVFDLASARTRGRMFTLSGPDGAIAYVLGIQHDDIYYALKTSYRADHARHAPGQVLFGHLIQHMCEREPGVRTIELLGTDSRWKREFATRTREERDFEVMRPDPIGLSFALAKGQLRPALERAAEQDPRVARFIEFAKRARGGLMSALSRRNQES